MAEPKGFDGWVEIFRGGSQVDSTGQVHDGNQLIDQAIQKFNADEHEPPLVVGHPTQDGPALGWVEGLRKSIKDGVAILEAKFNQVVPEFAQMVEQGLYKKRSAAFYSDGTLRHVGFLGAMPPALKSLKNIAFKRLEEGINFSYTWHFAEVAQSPEQQALAAREKKLGIGGNQHMEEKTFTLADLQAAEGKVRAQLAAEFAEREKRLKRGQELTARLDKLVSDGKVPPAIIDASFKEFVMAIDQGPVLEFAEGKPSPAEFLLGKLEGMAKLDLFSEIATKDKAGAEFTEAQKQEALGLSIAAKVQPQTK